MPLLPSDESLPFALLPTATDVGSVLKRQQKSGPSCGHGRGQQGRRSNRHPTQTETATTITVVWRGELAAVPAPAPLADASSTSAGTILILLNRLFPLQLYSTAFPRTVHDLQFRVDDLLDQLVGFRGEHRPLRVLLQHLDARLVHQERIVQYVEVVVQHT